MRFGRIAALFVLPLAAGCPQSGTPPDSPSTPDGADRGYPNHRYPYSAAATDPDGDSVSLQFDWGDGVPAGWSAYVASGASVTDTHAWSSSGSYAVRCRARESDDVWGDWSGTLTVMIVGDGDMLWEHDLGSRAVGSPTLLAEGVLCGTEQGDLFCVDTTGREVWRWQGGTEAALHGPAVVAGDSLVFFATTGDRVRCLDAAGDTVWDVLVGYECTPPALGPDGLLYFGAADGRLHVYGQDGRLRWSTQHGGAIRGPVVISSDTLAVFGTDDGRVVAVGPERAERWTFAAGGRVRLTPALGDDGAVYVGSEDDTLYAIGPDGQVRWRYGTGSNIRSSVAVGSDGRVYFGAGFSMICLDRQGLPAWQYGTGGYVRSAPTLTGNGRVYFGSDDGSVHAVDADGNLLWKHECAGVVDGSCLLLETGLVVCAGGSKLYGIAGTGAPADAPWPTFRHDPQRTGRGE